MKGTTGVKIASKNYYLCNNKVQKNKLQNNSGSKELEDYKANIPSSNT